MRDEAPTALLEGTSAGSTAAAAASILRRGGDPWCLHYQARGPRGTSVATRTASFGLDSAQTKLGAAILFFSLQFFYSTIAWFSYKKIYYGMLCLVYF